MATESVKILIEAEDKATAALKAAANEQEKVAAKAELTRVRAEKQLAAERVELERGAEAAAAFRLELEGLSEAEAKNIARQKELINEQKRAKAEQEKLANVGGAKSTKAGTEFFGAVANLAGGNAIGSVAGQLAGLTEKTSQFSEVAKTGGAAATAFKVGLVGAAGAIGFQVGSVIGNAIFETERWNKELETSVETLKKLELIRLSNLDKQFSDFTSGLSLSPDVEGDVASRLSNVDKEISNLEQRKKAASNAIKELQASQNGWLDLLNPLAGKSKLLDQTSLYDDLSGATNQLISSKSELVKQDEATLEKLRSQKEELERIVGIEAERAQKAKQIAEMEASESFVQGLADELEMINAELEGTQNALKALRGGGASFQSTEAKDLLDQIDAAKEKLDLQKQEREEKKKAQEEEKKRLEDLDKLRKNESDNLKLRVTLLTKGKEAQDAERLQLQGLTEEQAKAVAAGQSLLDKAVEQDNLARQGGKRNDLQAFESRLLTRGSDIDPTKSTAANTEKLVKLSEEQLKKLDEYLKAVEGQNNNQKTPEIKFEVVKA